MNSGQLHDSHPHNGSTLPQGMPRPGDTVDNCRISDIKGEGSVGIVYRAFEVGLEIEQAIKMLKPTTIEYVRRKFESEAKISARLDHPNIVKVAGSGIYNGVSPYIKMEYIDGKSLRDYLAAHSYFDPIVCLAIVSVVSHALQYAHQQSFSIWGNTQQKLVHRDLKPENLLLSKKGVLKITDFGLAQLDNEKHQSGWGTPDYMSPEQHAHREVDCRSDVFSLGILLYEMLTGTRPFPSDTDQMADAKSNGSFSPVTKHNPSVPQNICSIVVKCLEPDPEKRYRTYESLALAVDSILEDYSLRSADDVIASFVDNPSEYQPFLTANKAKPKSGGNKIRLIATVVAILVIAFLAGFSVWKWFGNATDGQTEREAVRTTTENPAEPQTNVLKPGGSNAPHDMHTPRRSGISARPSVHSTSKTTSTNTEGTNSKQSQPKSLKPTPDPVSSVSLLHEPMSAFRKSEYTKTISVLKGLPISSLQGRTRDSAIVLLADSYYRTRAIKEVMETARAYDVDDSRFHMLIAYASEILDDYSEAFTRMDKAVMAPSVLGQNNRSELLKTRADLYYRYFEKKKTTAAKDAMLDAYRLFIREGCKGETEGCRQARELVRSHEQ